MAIALKSRHRLLLAVRPMVAALMIVLSSWPAADAADIAKDGSGIPKDASGFTEHVAELLRMEIAGVAVTIKGPLTLGLGGMQANLDRIFNFCKRDSVRCPHEVTNYVKAVVQVYRDQNAAPSREAVRVVLRTEEYVRQVQGSALPDASAMQSRAFAPGLVVLLALDSPRTIRMLNEKDDKALGLTADEVYELGLKNTRASLKPLTQVAKAAKRAEIGQLVGDTYEPSRLALHDDWAPLAAAQNGPAAGRRPLRRRFGGGGSPAAGSRHAGAFTDIIWVFLEQRHGFHANQHHEAADTNISLGPVVARYFGYPNRRAGRGISGSHRCGRLGRG
jgi:hypothetical protein